MHDAQLNLRFRKRRFDGLRKTLETVHTRNQDVFDAPVLELRQNVQPELGAFRFADPKSQ